LRLTLCLLLALATALPLAAGDDGPEQLMKSGHADDALHALNLHLQDNPRDAAAFNLLSRTYYQLEIWDTAILMAEKSIALDPRNSIYHQWLGRAAGRKAEVSNPFTAFTLARKVRSEFERAVAFDGNNISARADLAEYYLEAPGFLGGDKNKARQQADAIALHDPALGRYVIARIEEKRGTGKAEEEYKKAIELSAVDAARYWIELASYYRRAGRTQDMESAITQSLAATRHVAVPEFDGASMLLVTGRNFPGAVQMVRHYLAGDAVSEDAPAFQAHLLLGQLLEKQGDRRSAAEQYRAALELASQFRPARDALARVSR
jgi:tetratricopeptide (TPR) repeat protein